MAKLTTFERPESDVALKNLGTILNRLRGQILIDANKGEPLDSFQRQKLQAVCCFRNYHHFYAS